MTTTKVTVVRVLTVAVVVAFLGVLAWYLGQPGYSHTRLVLFVLLGGLAVSGAAGVVYRRELVAAVSACGLLLLGFWQAVLWVFIFPVIGVLVVGIVVVASDERTRPSDAG